MNSSFDYYKGLLEQTLGIPFTSGNSVKVLKNGDRIFPAMLKAIDQAKERVEFLTFVYWTGNLSQVNRQYDTHSDLDNNEIYININQQYITDIFSEINMFLNMQ